MTRAEKSYQIIELATMMQNSYCGISLEDIATHFECSKRTAQRMKSVVEDMFFFSFEEVETYDTRKKRWRIKKGTVNGLVEISSQEVCILERVIKNITDDEDKKNLEFLAEKLKTHIQKQEDLKNKDR